jgi:hypothetical protein
MSFYVRNKIYQKTLKKNMHKKLKYIPAEQYFLYYQECGVKFTIPNLKTNNNKLSTTTDTTAESESSLFVLCRICLKQLSNSCSAIKISLDQNNLLYKKIFERKKYNENINKLIPREKTDHRNYLEIRNEMEKETKKELGIPKSDFY